VPILRAPLLRDAVAESLTDMIVKGELAPGQRLHEGTLCAMLGVSRSPLRDALRIMEGQGLVHIEPRRGAIVATMERPEILDLFNCRVLIQPEMVRLATEHLHEPQFDRLAALIGEMEKAAAGGHVFEFLDRVKDFLAIIEAACPNRLLVELVSTLWRRGMRFRAVGQRQPHQMERSIADHKALLESLREGDVDGAAATMVKMIGASRRAILSALDQKGLAAENVPEPITV
jgi:DNA-binding GntR family transcriptional regulator